MRNISSVLCLTVVFLLAMWNESSIAVTQTVTAQSSGSFVGTSIDLDGDGIPATTATFEITASPFGKFSGHNFTEVKLTSTTCTTPNGGTGIESALVDGSEVFRLDSTGDLLFTKLTSLAICFPTGPNDPSFSFTFEETFTGGTGKFANASGTQHVTGTGVFVDPTGNLAGFTATSTGTITTK